MPPDGGRVDGVGRRAGGRWEAVMLASFRTVRPPALPRCPTRPSRLPLPEPMPGQGGGEVPATVPRCHGAPRDAPREGRRKRARSRDLSHARAVYHVRAECSLYTDCAGGGRGRGWGGRGLQGDPGGGRAVESRGGLLFTVWALSIAAPKSVYPSHLPPSQSQPHFLTSLLIFPLAPIGQPISFPPALAHAGAIGKSTGKRGKRWCFVRTQAID